MNNKRKSKARRPARTVKARVRPASTTSSKIEVSAKQETRGRPTKYTEDVVRILEKEFRNNRKIITACRRANITRETYYQWLKDFPEFSDRMEAAQESPIADAEDSVMTQVRGDPKRKIKPDGQLALRLLERIDPKRYKTQIETRDITPPSARRVIVGTPDAHPMIRPDAEVKPQKAKG